MGPNVLALAPRRVPADRRQPGHQETDGGRRLRGPHLPAATSSRSRPRAEPPVSPGRFSVRIDSGQGRLHVVCDTISAASREEQWTSETTPTLRHGLTSRSCQSPLVGGSTTPGRIFNASFEKEAHMDPIETLSNEHGLIRQYLDVLSMAAEKIENSKRPSDAFFEKAVDLSRTFADGFHHFKEEHVLFVQLAQKKRGEVDASSTPSATSTCADAHWSRDMEAAPPGYAAKDPDIKTRRAAARTLRPCGPHRCCADHIHVDLGPHLLPDGAKDLDRERVCGPGAGVRKTEGTARKRHLRALPQDGRRYGLDHHPISTDRQRDGENPSPRAAIGIAVVCERL